MPNSVLYALHFEVYFFADSLMRVTIPVERRHAMPLSSLACNACFCGTGSAREDARYELLTMELPAQVAMFVPLSSSESYMRMGWYLNK